MISRVKARKIKKSVLNIVEAGGPCCSAEPFNGRYIGSVGDTLGRGDSAGQAAARTAHPRTARAPCQGAARLPRTCSQKSC